MFKTKSCYRKVGLLLGLCLVMAMALTLFNYRAMAAQEKYIGEIWGVTRQQVIREGESGGYVGKAYFSLPNPGQAERPGNWVLNCGGLVSNVIENAGGNLGIFANENFSPDLKAWLETNMWPTTRSRSDLYVWMALLGMPVRCTERNNGRVLYDIDLPQGACPSAVNPKWYEFSSYQEMLKSGLAEKADLLIIKPTDGHSSYDYSAGKISIQKDCHIGFFWGDTPSDPKIFHSSPFSTTGGVAIEHIRNFNTGFKGGKTNIWYLVKLFEDKGKAKILKASTDPLISDKNTCYDLAGTEYTVYQDPALTKTIGVFTVDSQGQSNVLELTAGTYYVKETRSGRGYDVDPKTHILQIKAGETTELKVQDRPQSDRIELLLSKLDKERNTAEALGDGTLAGAEYTVKFYAADYLAKGPDYDPATEGATPARTWVLQTDQEGVIKLDDSHWLADDDFYLDSEGEPILPFGTVTIQETKPPTGYLLDETVFVRHIGVDKLTQRIHSYRSGDLPLSKEQVITGVFSLSKYRTGGEQSEILQPEEGAEFVAVLKKHVEAAGSFDAALDKLESLNSLEWSKLVTDQEGFAQSSPLAYGVYLVKQTKASLETELYPESFIFEVKSPDQAVKYFAINNKPKDYSLRIIKKDSQTGEKISLSPAIFKIKDQKTGEYVGQRVGSKVYRQFMTSAHDQAEVEAGTFYLATEEKGTLVIPLRLRPGTYLIEEVASPNGYYLSEKPIEVEVSEQTSPAGEVIEIEIENQPQYGELVIHKQGEIFDGWRQVDKTLSIQDQGQVEGEEIEVPRGDEELTLTRTFMQEEREETLPSDQASPTGPTEQDSDLDSPSSGFKPVERVETERIKTDTDGHFEREVACGNYLVTDSEGEEVARLDVPEGETGLLSFSLSKKIKEGPYRPGKIYDQDFSYYKPVYRTDYLAGASFELLAQEEIRSFDGKTVFYREGEKILFAKQEIVDGNGLVLYSKGEAISLPGLSQELLDNPELVTSQAMTESGPLKLSKLPLGRYSLQEVKAPAGYIRDQENRELTFGPQAQTILVDLKETDKLINRRQKLAVGLTKDLLANPYFEDKSFDHIAIGVYNEEEILGLAPDSLVYVGTPDSQGQVVVEDLPQGKYYFKEISTKDGYFLDPQSYTVQVLADEKAQEDKVTSIPDKMVNRPKTETIKIYKRDKLSNRPLAGVEFRLYRVLSNGEKLALKNPQNTSGSFITNSQGEIVVEDLPYGTYVFEEVKAQPGYLPTDQEATIGIDGQARLDFRVDNEPSQVAFKKLDAKTGQPVLGAKLRLLDHEGQPVYIDGEGYVTGPDQGRPAVWLTDGDDFVVRGLSIGAEYCVEELEAPAGYHLADKQIFRVMADRGIQVREVVNRPYEPVIKTKAFETNTGEKEVKAEERVYLSDIIYYRDFIPGRTYLAKARLVSKHNPNQVLAEQEVSFIPQSKEGEVQVDFGPIDTRRLAGQEVVVLEQVFDCETGERVASHEDLADPDQTIRISAEPEPYVKTGENTGYIWILLLGLALSLLVFTRRVKRTIP